MPVAAGVVGDLCIGTLLTARDMAAERRRAAVFDRRHHLELAETQMACLGLTPSGAVGAEDIRHLQSWSRHDHRTLRRRLNILDRVSQQATARAVSSVDPKRTSELVKIHALCGGRNAGKPCGGCGLSFGVAAFRGHHAAEPGPAHRFHPRSRSLGPGGCPNLKLPLW